MVCGVLFDLCLSSQAIDASGAWSDAGTEGLDEASRLGVFCSVSAKAGADEGSFAGALSLRG